MREKLACIIVVCVPLLCVLANVFVVVFYIVFGPLYIPYLLWMILSDREAGETGGRESRPVKKWQILEWFRMYFDATIHLEEELSKDKTYLFGVYPHGVISMGVWANFVAETDSLQHLSLRVATLKGNFFVPIFRELLLWAGFIASSKKSLTHCLEQKKTSVALIVGGAEEALATNRGIVLDKRRGFIEVALKTGAHLVPVYTFGERRLYTVYDPAEGGCLSYIQKKMKGFIGWSIPFFYGWLWIFPKQEKLITVIGAPIWVQKCENPTREQIDDYHTRFKEALLKLHEKHRALGKEDELKVVY